MKKCLLLAILLSINGLLNAQSNISGNAYDMMQKPLSFCNVTLKLLQTSGIVAYTTSDKDGKFSFDINKTGTFDLSFSKLSYKAVTFQITIESHQKYIQNAILSDEILNLNEVIILGERPIVIKKDTIIINAKSFTNGNETVIEDLLKKLPGLNVTENGTIKVGDQEVEKVMIEGDDFFEKGYKLLTKNMNANVIDKVEIYQRYSSNNLLKDIENSDKVALNLTLKKNLAVQWFGNINAGYGVISENRYEVRTNLMSFTKKAKYYFIGNLNNTGFDAIGDINQLIRPVRLDEPGIIGDDENAGTLINIENSILNLKNERINFNNAELATLNTIFTLSPKIKVKALAFMNWDENSFFKDSFQTFYTNQEFFTNTEKYNAVKKKKSSFFKTDLNYEISKNGNLQFSSKYNYGTGRAKTNLLFNAIETNEHLNENNELIDQAIVYTYKLKDKKVLLLSGRYIDEKSPQNYNNNSYLFSDLFPGSEAQSTRQTVMDKMKFTGIQGHLFSKSKKDNLLEIKTGYQFRKDILSSELSFPQNDTMLFLPEGFQNSLTYKSGDLYLGGEYLYKLKKIALTANFEAHQLFNSLENKIYNKNQAPFYINPKLGINWEINTANKISVFGSFNKSNAKLVDVYDNYILTTYRSLDKGTGEFNQLKSGNVFLNYAFGNFNTRFFVTASVLLYKNHNFFSTNSFIEPNYSLSEKILIKDRETISYNTNGSYFFKALSSSLKFDVNYSKSNYKNVINNVQKEVKTDYYVLGFEFRSGFDSFFNYNIGSKWTINKFVSSKINSSKSNMSFVDLNLAFFKKLNIDVQTERYQFSNNNTKSDYYFLDVKVKYAIKNNKLAFSLYAQNLFNTKKFREYYVNDFSVLSTEYRLLPRYLILKMDYRF